MVIIRRIYRQILSERLRVLIKQTLRIPALVGREIADIRYTYKLSLDRKKFELRRAVHRIEKSLLHGQRRIGAGIEVAIAIVRYIELNETYDYLSESDIGWAISALAQFVEKLKQDLRAFEGEEELFNRITSAYNQLEAVLKKYPNYIQRRYYLLEEPIDVPYIQIDELRSFFTQRHSIRHFSDRHVSDECILRAIGVARYSPSACNRHGVSVTIVRDKSIRNEILEIQGGISGFEKYLNTVLVISGSRNAYPNYNERHAPYVEGSMFAMNLIWGLLAQSIYSVCLNWSYSRPSLDNHAHKIIGLPQYEEIVFLMAIGYPMEKTKAPNSAKRSVEDFIHAIL